MFTLVTHFCLAFSLNQTTFFWKKLSRNEDKSRIKMHNQMFKPWTIPYIVKRFFIKITTWKNIYYISSFLKANFVTQKKWYLRTKHTRSFFRKLLFDNSLWLTIHFLFKLLYNYWMVCIHMFFQSHHSIFL